MGCLSLEMRIASVQKRIATIERYLNAPGLPGTFVTGRSGIKRAYSNKLNAQIDKTISYAVALPKLRAQVIKLQGRMCAPAKPVRIAKPFPLPRIAAQTKDNGIKDRVDKGETVNVKTCVGMPCTFQKTGENEYKLTTLPEGWYKGGHSETTTNPDPEYFRAMALLKENPAE